MQVSEASRLCLEYHKSHSKENSMRAYKLVLSKLCEEFGDENLEADNHGKGPLLPETDHGGKKAANQT